MLHIKIFQRGLKEKMVGNIFWVKCVLIILLGVVVCQSYLLDENDGVINSSLVNGQTSEIASLRYKQFILNNIEHGHFRTGKIGKPSRKIVKSKLSKIPKFSPPIRSNIKVSSKSYIPRRLVLLLKKKTKTTTSTIAVPNH